MNRGNNQSMLDEVYEETVKMHSDGWSGKEETSFKGNIFKGKPWFTKVVLDVLYSMYGPETCTLLTSRLRPVGVIQYTQDQEWCRLFCSERVGLFHIWYCHEWLGLFHIWYCHKGLGLFHIWY